MYGMSVKRADNEELLAADDRAMDVSGYTRFKIKGCQIRAIVSKSFKDEILLGWRDLVRLNVIPATFPSLGGAAQVEHVVEFCHHFGLHFHQIWVIGFLVVNP